MGLTIFIEYDVESSTYIKRYECSNCNAFIYETQPIHIANLSYDRQHNFGKIPLVCSCGEEFITFTPIYEAIIDIMINE